MEYTKETGSYMGRVANVVVVWALTGSLAARLGVLRARRTSCSSSCSASCPSRRALTTVCNALCARLFVSVGDEAASAAGKALNTRRGYFLLHLRPLLGVQEELLFAYTRIPWWSTPRWLYFLLIASVATYWYKTLEGGLIGRGDATRNFIFYVGSAAALWRSGWRIRAPRASR